MDHSLLLWSLACEDHGETTAVREHFVGEQFGEEEAAVQIEKAVNDALDEGYRTGDIMSEGCTQVGCVKMGEILMEKIKA